MFNHKGIINKTFVALWTREILLQRFVVASLCERKMFQTFVGRIEVHEIFVCMAFFRLR